MAHKPHKWKIRAGLLVLGASGYKIYLAAREVVKNCDVQSAQICIQAQNSLKHAIYAAVAGALVESRRESWTLNPLRGCVYVKFNPLLAGVA